MKATYLKIENAGTCNLDFLTLLGLGTGRADAESIGQFGSGAKHAICLLLRKEVELVICMGREKISFETVRKESNGTTYEHVHYRVGGGRLVPLGFTLDFGAEDWIEIGMALRELISNALDASGGEWDACDIRLVAGEPRCADGKTRVYVGATTDVVQYVRSLDANFLHRTGLEKMDLLDKGYGDKSTAKIYRKGVFVRQINSIHDPSLYDYNFGDELKIDECRNLSDYGAEVAIGHLISRNMNACRKLIETSVNRDARWEHGFGYYSFNPISDTVRKTWREAWEQAYGEECLIAEDETQAAFIAAKGLPVKIVENDSLFRCLVNCGIHSGEGVLSAIEEKGLTECAVAKEIRNAFVLLWNRLDRMGFVAEKERPELRCFRGLMSGGQLLGGYYQNGVVWLNEENAMERKIVLEEIAHHITEATDNSRDFQDYLLRLASKLLSETLSSEV